MTSAKTAYDLALEGLAEGNVVICMPGIDQDDNEPRVLVSSFVMTPVLAVALWHDDAGVRLAALLGIAAFARAGIEQRTGVRPL